MNRMNRRQCIQTTALVAGAACLGIVDPLGAAEDNRWQRVGPDFQPTKGLCYHVLPHPQRPAELLVGTRPQGLLLSLDQAKTWRRTSEKFPDNGNVGPNPESMGRAPSRPDTVYAGIETLGARRSDDGGKTWHDLSASLPKGRARNGVSVAVHPTDPETAWLGTDGGIFATNDGGRSWRRLTQGLPTGKAKSGKDVNQTISQIFVDPLKPQRVWFGMYACGLQEPAGVWRSDDGGLSWQPSSDGIQGGDQVSGPVTCRRDWIMGLARSASAPETFFAATPLAVYRSSDGAKTWQKLPHLKGGQAVAVHPRDANRVFLAVAEGRVEQSTDGGKTWRDLSAGLRLGRESGAPVYKIDFVGSDGKAQVLEGTDRRFQNQVLSFTFDPRDPDTLYACAHAGLYRLKLSATEGPTS